MRTILLSLVVMFSLAVQAQTYLPGGRFNQLQQPMYAGANHVLDSAPAKKWFVNKYIGMSTGMGFFNGGNATFLSVPIGLQLNRRINNNWYAFAGVSAAPTYIHFNQSFLNTGSNNKFPGINPSSRSNRFDMFSRAELGLMYINDQKTFSISGSIGVEKSSYPMVPFTQMGTMRPNGLIAPNR